MTGDAAPPSAAAAPEAVVCKTWQATQESMRGEVDLRAIHDDRTSSATSAAAVDGPDGPGGATGGAALTGVARVQADIT